MGCGVITYQRETARAVREDIEPLLALHYAEIGQDGLTPSPDWPRLEKLCDDGMLFVLTARKDGALIGYNAFILCRHLHYAEAVAQNDVIFVHPAHRGGRVACRLISHAETALFALGVSKIYYHAKPANHLGDMLVRIGYPMVETIHARGR